MPMNAVTKGRYNPETWTMEGSGADVLNRAGLLASIPGPAGFGAHITATTFVGGALTVATVDAAGTYAGGLEPLVFLNVTTGAITTPAILLAVMKAVTFVGTQGAGSGYAPSDTITLTGGTFTAATVLTVTNTLLQSLVGNAIGSGYNFNDQITLSGGTATVAAKVTVTQLGLATGTIVAAGTGYAATDTINLAGGVYFLGSVSGPSINQAQLTVATTKLVSVAVGNNGATGSGYKVNDTVTLGGGTSSTAAIMTVDSVNAAGAITAAHISTAGSYTVNASTWNQSATSGSGTGAVFVSGQYGVNSVTTAQAGLYTQIPTGTITQNFSSGSGTGATFTATWGVAGFVISNRGIYTANTATFTPASTTGTGTGATFQTALYGVNVCSITTAGTYTLTPTSPTAQGSSSGSGTGASFMLLWGVASVTITNGGTGTASAGQICVCVPGGPPQGFWSYLTGLPPIAQPTAFNLVSYGGTGGDTTEDTLLSVAIKGGTFNSPGDSITIYAEGVTGADANNKTVKLYFGNTSFTSGTQAGSAVAWWMQAEVTYQGPGSNLFTVLFTGQFAGTSLTSTNVFAPQVGTADILIKVTGTNAIAIANDVVATELNVQLAA